MITVRTSTTARTLRSLRLWLLALTAVVLGLSFTVSVKVHSTIDTAARHTLPAVMAVSAATQALGEADSDAVTGFVAGTVTSTGPGVSYQAQITLAGQSLEQAAEANQAGDQGSQQLQLVDSQLAAYRQLIEQAQADYVSGATTLGVVELVYASRWMHGSVLAGLTTLHTLEMDALASQISSVWMTSLAAVMWTVPSFGLFVLLVVAQVYVRRRFRRRINGWLVAATALLILLALGTATVLPSEHRLNDAVAGVDQLVRDRTVSFQSVSTTDPIKDELFQRCRTDKLGCGVALPAVGIQAQTNHATAVTNAANAADQGYYLEFVIPAAGLAVAALVLLGFQRRIEEYRRRAT